MIYWRSKPTFILIRADKILNDECYHILNVQTTAYFLGQLTVLSTVLHHVPLASFSFQAFLAFTFAWLLSDLAVFVSLKFKLPTTTVTSFGEPYKKAFLRVFNKIARKC